MPNVAKDELRNQQALRPRLELNARDGISSSLCCGSGSHGISWRRRLLLPWLYWIALSGFVS
jgi:hypothetical protein